MKIFFLLFFAFSEVAHSQSSIAGDDERWRKVMEARQRNLAESRACTNHPDAVRRNIDNNIRYLKADRNLNLTRYCMDMNQRRQFRAIVRSQAYREVADPLIRQKLAPDRGSLGDVSRRIRCSRRRPMGVRTPTSMLGGVRG